MLKKLRLALARWGHYPLALLCAAVILFSALWTRTQQAAEAQHAQALSDTSQRLSDVTPPPGARVWMPPVPGPVLRPYSDDPVYFSAQRLWRTHPAVDFAAAPGQQVTAMAAGTVLECADGVLIDHGDGWTSLYRGLAQLTVQPGQAVRPGTVIGLAGGGIPLEDAEGHICVTLRRNGVPCDFSSDAAGAPE